MDYLDPNTVGRVTNARYRDLAKQSEMRRLLEEARADRLPLREHLLLSIGDFLIAFGLRLKARYEPIRQPEISQNLR